MSLNPNLAGSITIFDQASRMSRQVMLPPGFPTTDFMNLLRQVFSLEEQCTVAGFRDDKFIYYTASTVCRNPTNFSRVGNKLTLVYGAGSSLSSSSGHLSSREELHSSSGGGVDFEDSEGTLLTDVMAEGAFKLMDSDNDGLVSAEDISHFIEHGVNIRSLSSDDMSDRDVGELVSLFISAFYSELGMSREEPVTLNDFCAWFLSTNHVGLRTLIVDICQLLQDQDVFPQSSSNSEEEDFIINKTLKRNKSTSNLHSNNQYPYPNQYDEHDGEFDARTTSSYNSSIYSSKEHHDDYFVHDQVSTLHPIEVVIDEIKKNLRLDNTTLKGLYYALLRDDGGDDADDDEDTATNNNKRSDSGVGGTERDFLVSRQTFNSRIYSLINMNPFYPNNSFDLETIQNLINSLYSAFATNTKEKENHNDSERSNGSISGNDSINTDDDDVVVHISSILCGMNLFCKGHSENNLTFTFKWFKNFCKGYVSSTCIRLFFANVCNVMYSISNQLLELVEMSSDKFANYISNAAIIQVNLNNPTQLSQQEFVECCQCGLDIIFQITQRELDFEQVFSSTGSSYKDDDATPTSPDTILSSESSLSGAAGDGRRCNLDSGGRRSRAFAAGGGSITSNNTNLSRASTVSSKSAGGKASAFPTTAVGAGNDFLDEYGGGTVNISDAYRILGLKGLTPKSILDHVTDVFVGFNSIDCNEEDFYLRRFEYNKVMQTLCVGRGGKHLASLPVRDRKIFDFLIGRIFHTYTVFISDSSTDSSSTADMCDSFELLIGLFALCGGSPLDKANAVINLMRRLGYLDKERGNSGDSCSDSEGEGEREMVSTSYLDICIGPIFKLIGALDPNLVNLVVVDDMASGVATNFVSDHDFGEDIPCDFLIKWIATVYKVLNSVHGQILIRQAILDEEVESSDGLHRILSVLTDYMNKEGRLGLEDGSDDNDDDSDDNDDNDDNDDVNNKDDDDSGNDSFKYENQKARVATLRVDVDDSSNGSLDGNPSNIVTQELRAAKSVFGFVGFTASDVMEMLAEIAPNAIVSQSKWMSLAANLAKIAVISEANMPLSRAMALKVFRSFVDNEDSISNASRGLQDDIEPCCSYYDFAAGLVLLSDSSVEDKLMVSFTLVDSNRDGQISFFELCVLVHAYLNIIRSLSTTAAAKVASLGVPLEALADAVAKEGFHALNLSLDSMLKIDDVCEIANDCMFLADINTLQ